MLTRRRMTALSFSFLGACSARLKPSPDFSSLEARLGGRIGVFATNLATGDTIAQRADERFAMCSTFKVALAAFVLQRTDEGALSLDDEIAFSENDLVANSPVTSPRIADGALPVKTLCGAAVERSDNTAANLLLDLIGGPTAMTDFFRSLGDKASRLDRRELELNSNLPGDERDTTTPRAMTGVLRALLTEPSALSATSRERLHEWMVNEQNGGRRIRAAAPDGWSIANKPGTSVNGAVNDIALARRPDGAAIMMSVYTNAPGAKIRESEAIIAETARLVFTAL